MDAKLLWDFNVRTTFFADKREPIGVFYSHLGGEKKGWSKRVPNGVVKNHLGGDKKGRSNSCIAIINDGLNNYNNCPLNITDISYHIFFFSFLFSNSRKHYMTKKYDDNKKLLRKHIS